MGTVWILNNTSPLSRLFLSSNLLIATLVILLFSLNLCCLMEVKTHALSAFDFNSQPPYNSYIEQSELRATDILSSDMSASSNDGEYCERSVSNAAMKVQKVYRSYRTRRMLADSAVVAEVLWYCSITINLYTIFYKFSSIITMSSVFRLLFVHFILCKWISLRWALLLKGAYGLDFNVNLLVIEA